MGPATLALALVVALLALLPARRLAIAGVAPRTIGAYVLAVWLLAMLVAELRGPARFLIPFLLVLYLVPFVTLRSGIEAIRGRLRPPGDPPRPMRNVTPTDARPDSPGGPPPGGDPSDRADR